MNLRPTHQWWIFLPALAILLVAACSSGDRLPTEPFPLTEVESSIISHVGYDPTTQYLTIVFHDNDTTHVYHHVSRGVHFDLMAADSIDDFYNDNIRGIYGYESE